MNIEPFIQVRAPKPNYTCCRTTGVEMGVGRRGRSPAASESSVHAVYPWDTHHPFHLPLQVSLLFLSLPLLVLLYFPCHCVAFSQRFLTSCDFPHPWMKTLSSGWWWCMCRGVHREPSLHESPVLSEFNFWKQNLNSLPSFNLILRQWWRYPLPSEWRKKVLNEENEMKKEKNAKKYLKTCN